MTFAVDKTVETNNPDTKLHPDSPNQDQLPAFERDVLQLRSVHGTFTDSSTSFIRNLYFKAPYIPINFNVPLHENPEWFDIKKFRRGQKFALDNISGLLVADFISIILLFAIEQGLGPFIFTQANDSPFKCFIRYKSTFKRLRSWFEDDIWSEESRKNSAAVNAMHKNIHNAMSACSVVDLKKKMSLENLDELRSKFHIYQLIKEDVEDFSSFTPEVQIQEFPKLWFSQLSMSFVQWAFAGLIVTYPQNFGVHHAKEEDLNAFIHMWKSIGYILGIKDEFNFFDGDLQTVRDRSKCLLAFVIPYFKQISPKWEFMSRCTVDGVSFFARGIPILTFEGTLKHMFHVLNIKTPKLNESLTFWQYFPYYFTRFLFEYLMRVPFVAKLVNYAMLKNADVIENASPELLNRWKAKDYFYMKN